MSSKHSKKQAKKEKKAAAKALKPAVRKAAPATKAKAKPAKKPAEVKVKAAKGIPGASPTAPKAVPSKAVPSKVVAPVKGAKQPAASQAPAEKAGKPGQTGAPGAAGHRTGPARKSGRRTPPPRRGPNGEILAPGELLLPGGTQRPEEVQYLFRGCVAAERTAVEEGVADVVTKRGEPERADAEHHAKAMRDRFESGAIEPLMPARTSNRRTFQGVVERARQRRREIGAFLRGLDMGRTETSHMDSHGEASLQSLMEWAARLENLADADEPGNADYAQFHRGLDQLDNTTEALMIDVEQTLRRRRDRLRPA